MSKVKMELLTGGLTVKEIRDHLKGLKGNTPVFIYRKSSQYGLVVNPK